MARVGLAATSAGLTALVQQAQVGLPPGNWKNGATPGYSSHIGFVPQMRSGVVLLANQNTCPVTRAGYQILATLNGKAGAPNAPEGEGQ